MVFKRPVEGGINGYMWQYWNVGSCVCVLWVYTCVSVIIILRVLSVIFNVSIQDIILLMFVHRNGLNKLNQQLEHICNWADFIEKIID